MNFDCLDTIIFLRALIVRKKLGDRMLSDTLTSGLQSYQIGQKIRALRLTRKLGLV